FAAPFATITEYRNALFYFGLALMVTGVVIRQYAIAVLGRYHTMDVTTRQDQPLVEAGPYRWVRHPSYSGAFLTVIGILLCSTNWLSLAGPALMPDRHAVVGVKELEVGAPGSEGQVFLNKRPAVATVDGSIEPIPCRLTVLPARLSREQPPGAAAHVFESLPATAGWPRRQDLPAAP